MKAAVPEMLQDGKDIQHSFRNAKEDPPMKYSWIDEYLTGKLCFLRPGSEENIYLMM